MRLATDDELAKYRRLQRWAVIARIIAWAVGAIVAGALGFLVWWDAICARACGG